VDKVNRCRNLDYYLACDAEGRAWGFGLNLRYQLGLGESRATFSPRDPVQIGYFESQKIFVVDVVASIDHSLALDSKGIAYTWGANQIGRSHRDIKDAYGNITNFTLIQGK
jgi:alpha-tubulin suppressor-like RCC1 family protein